MFLKLFYPVLFLLFFQLLGYIFWNGFAIETKIQTNFVVSFCYLFCILTIIFFGIFNNKEEEKLLKKMHFENKKINFIFILIALAFILRPTIVLIGLSMEFGGEYVRTSYFNDPGFFDIVYGKGIIATLTNYYIVPILWFYLIFIMDDKSNFGKFTFYFLLILLVVYNASYSGRFYIYFGLIVLYLRCIFNKVSFIEFIKNNSIIIFIFTFFSYFILVNRQYEYGGKISFTENLLSIFEYHLISPYLLSQKIDDGVFKLDVYSYPFRVVVENLFIPFYLFILKVNINDLAYFDHTGRVLSVASLYSEYTQSYYNAYGSMFYFFYADTKLFSPIFVILFIGYLLISSKFIGNHLVRYKYLAFLSLIMYFSLFQAMLFAPGYLLIIIGLPLFYLFFSKRNR